MESQLEKVKKLIEKGESFTFENFSNSLAAGTFGGKDSPDWSIFKTRTKNVICEIVEKDSPAMILVEEALIMKTEGNYISTFNLVKEKLISALNNAAEILENDEFGELKKPKSLSKSPLLSNKVFVVHGHDQGLKTDVERFLHEIGLEPVVLHRVADQGATLIEKFEKHSDVGFAFILLTPDEISYTVDQMKIEDNKRIFEFRARPNVIFEFGYFVGKLGRERVCCLHKGNVVVPSDLNGLVYKKIDDSIESQAFLIVKELKAAGYNIKM